MATEINHSDRDHSILSASASKRWLACPPSARAERLFPDKGSEYARQGTVFHELMEAMVRGQVSDLSTVDRIRSSEWYDREMEDCSYACLDFVHGMYQDALNWTRDAKLILEQRLDLRAWVPEGFGTGDVIVIEDDLLTIADYKYGKGVRVEARDNPQMMLYALGALHEYGWQYGFKQVRMIILQPRLDNFSEHTMKLQDLIDWGNGIRGKAMQAYMGDGQFTAGDHCKFCKAKTYCRAFRDLAFECVQSPADMLTDGELGEALRHANAVADWAKSVKEHALDRALSGASLPGWKLVEGRSNRVITEPQKVAEALIGSGIPEEMVWRPREIRTLTDLEKTAGKKQFAALAGQWITKPKGAPKLAEASDPRPEYNPAEDMFKDV